MFEGIRSKRIATAVAVLGGGLALAGCGNTVEGVGNVRMVDCSPHGTPHTNTATIGSVPRGVQIQMGNEIGTDNQGHSETGDFVVNSKGNGQFSVNINSGNNANNNAAIIPNYLNRPDTVTVTDNGELYAIQGSAGPLGTTALNVSVSCQ